MAVDNQPRTWVALSGPEFNLPGPSDSNLAFGSGTAQGTDRSTVLANVMSSTFASGNVGILWDRAITGVLPIYGSNVVIKGLHSGCGLRRPQAWIGPTIYNAQRVMGLSSGSPVAPAIGATGAVTLGGMLQFNLAIEGLTIHGGQAAGVTDPNNGNATGPKNGILLWGVDGARIAGNSIYDCGQYMVFSANVRRARYRDNFLACSNVTNSDGRDGFHFGLCDDVTVEANRITSGDDAIAFNANDGNPAILPYPFARPGPITNARAINNVFAGCGAGIRILSSDQLIDGLLVSGTRGTCRTYLFLIDTFTAANVPAGDNPRPGAGLIGSVAIRDHDVLSQADAVSLGDIYINAAFDAIDIRGWKVRTTPGIVTPRLRVLAGTAYNSFACEFEYTDTDAGNTARVLIQDDGAGKLARVRADVARTSAVNQAVPIYRKAVGSLKALLVEANAESINSLVDYAGGAIESISARGVHRNAGAGNGSVSVAVGLTLTNLAAHGLATALVKSGAGTVTHQYPASETYSFA